MISISSSEGGPLVSDLEVAGDEIGDALEKSKRRGYFGLEIARRIVDDPRVQLLSMSAIGILCLLQARSVAGFPTPADPRMASRILRTGGVKVWKLAIVELLQASPPLVVEIDGFIKALPVGNIVKIEMAEKRALAAHKRWEKQQAELKRAKPRKSKEKPQYVEAESIVAIENAVACDEVVVDSPQGCLPGVEPPPAASPPKKGFKNSRVGCPNHEIYQLFIDVCTDLPRVQEVKLWHDQRKNRLLALWKKYPNLEFWKDFFTSVHESDFLCNRNGGDWKTDFDWLIKQANFAKVVEGNYVNKGKTRPSLFNANATAKPKDYEATVISEENEFMKFANQLEGSPTGSRA